MTAATYHASLRLDVIGASKAYHEIPALRGVNLTIEPGEVHALVGENGAGKSTLIKIISGVVAQDAGTVRLGDIAIAPGEVASARRAGIATIHQESTVFPDLNAIDNIFIGRDGDVGADAQPSARRWLLDPKRRRAEAVAALAALGEEIDVDRPLAELPLAARQMVAIARALSQRSRILILDEPTASLSAPECDTLFRAIHAMRARGVGMLYVSHRLAEVFALADRITVLRDGQVVEHGPTSAFTHDSLIRSMVGRDIAPVGDRGVGTDDARASAMAHDRPAPLTVTALTREPTFRDVSLTVRAGEVVGLAGLVGAGRSEVARALFGMDRYTSGRVMVDGTPLAPGSVQRAVAAGIALVPEDRQQCGLVLPMSVRENLLLVVMRRLAKRGLRSTGAEQTLVQRLIAALAVRTATPDLPVDALSGGNQQKVVVGKWLAMNPRVLILDEPTRGVDVGAKAELYAQIRTLANDGMATLLISSDLPEILALSDRILVMREGALAGELSRAEATEERILALAVPSDRPVTASVGHNPTAHQVTGAH